MARKFINIHLDLEGDPNEFSDVKKYLEDFIEHQDNTMIAWGDACILTVDRSWEPRQPVRGMLRLLKMHARTYKIFSLSAVMTWVHKFVGHRL